MEPIENEIPEYIWRVQRALDALHKQRRKLATAGVALLAAGLAWHVLFGANGMVAYQQKRAEYGTLQREIQDLQAQNEQLQQQVQNLRSDPKTIERQAREQLRYARPGEVIYTMPKAKAPDPPTSMNAQKTLNP